LLKICKAYKISQGFLIEYVEEDDGNQDAITKIFGEPRQEVNLTPSQTKVVNTRSFLTVVSEMLESA